MFATCKVTNYHEGPTTDMDVGGASIVSGPSWELEYQYPVNLDFLSDDNDAITSVSTKSSGSQACMDYIPSEPVVFKSFPGTLYRDETNDVIYSCGKLYHIKRKMGRGGFATCFHTVSDLGEDFATKIVKFDRMGHVPDAVVQEYQTNTLVRHQHICRLLHSCNDTRQQFFFFEHCPKGDLFDHIYKNGDGLAECEARLYALQVTSAVKHIHQRYVVHRDIKLENIFLDEHNNAKLGDFGLAVILDPANVYRKGVAGTHGYIAPEMLIGEGTHSFECDVWSLGVLFYYMVYGVCPFYADTAEEIARKTKEINYTFLDEDDEFRDALGFIVTDDFKDLIRSIFVKNPKDRPKAADILKHKWLAGKLPPGKEHFRVLRYT